MFLCSYVQKIKICSSVPLSKKENMFLCSYLKNMTKKDTWKMIIQTLISILTAIGTTLGMVSCM